MMMMLFMPVETPRQKKRLASATELIKNNLGFFLWEDKGESFDVERTHQPR